MGVNSLQWYYAVEIPVPGQEIRLHGEEWHHCFNVMRMQPGDSLILCDGKGKCAEGIILHAGLKEGIATVTHDRSENFSKPYDHRIVFGIAPTKNIDRTEFAVEKLVEIGASSIGFIECRHSERARIRADRMEKIAISAAKQSRKSIFTRIEEIQSLQAFVERQADPKSNTVMIACHLNEESKSLRENYVPGKNVVLLIGPEGGFSKEEVEWMKQKNVKFATLGPFRLRAETAAIVACAEIHFINRM